MSKNAITVIDQELIDDAKSTINLDDDTCDRARVSTGTLKDLISMCEDLIEINAELTKRGQKYKMAINDQIRFNMDSGSDGRSYMYLKQALKGDSDE